MSIFDNDDIKKANQIKNDYEKEKHLQNNVIRKETEHEATCIYIIECLNEFPTTAKKVNLKTERLYVKGYFMFKWLTSYKHIDAWRLGSITSNIDIFIDSNCTCYEKNIQISDTSAKPVSIEIMAKKMYYRFHTDYANTKEIIKDSFVRILAGQPMKPKRPL